MSRAEWTDTFLTDQRQVGDPGGDAVIKAVFARGHIRVLDQFMGQLVANDTMPDDLPDEVRAFLADTSALPPWADPVRLEAGARIFDMYGGASLAALVCASLPECYTMRTGVRILDLTSQLGEHTNRRLHQTAAMVLSVMRPGGFTPRGNGIRQTQKVRLIHAAIRYRILSAIGAQADSTDAGAEIPVVIPEAVRSVNDVVSRHGFDWQVTRDGMPINQEDQAFTLLTFGHVIPRALNTLGITLSEREYDAFLHCWNVSGFILGVNEALMAHNREEAEDLFARIKARQGRPSAAGARLTDSLLTVVEVRMLRWRILRPLGPILVRLLVGDATASMLGLDTRHHWTVVLVHRAVAAVFRGLQILFRPFERTFQPMEPLATRVGLRVVEHLCLATDDGTPRQVAIPEHWG